MRPVGQARGFAEASPAVLAPPEVDEDATTLVVARVDGAVAVVAAVHLGKGNAGKGFSLPLTLRKRSFPRLRTATRENKDLRHTARGVEVNGGDAAPWGGRRRVQRGELPMSRGASSGDPYRFDVGRSVPPPARGATRRRKQLVEWGARRGPRLRSHPPGQPRGGRYAESRETTWLIRKQQSEPAGTALGGRGPSGPQAVENVSAPRSVPAAKLASR